MQTGAENEIFSLILQGLPYGYLPNIAKPDVILTFGI